MQIESSIDRNQTDNGDRRSMAICPACGQKLFEVESIFYKGVFRLKCRRCKRYIRVKVEEEGS